MTLKKNDLLQMYRMMLLIRRFEEQSVQFYKNGEIRGSPHPCIGQEATAVGACYALRKDDYMTCTYRGHGQALAKGLDAKEAMAELLGRRTGCSKGKGGSMHFTDPEVGLLGENAIVGAGVPIAVGAALSAQLDGSDRVSITFCGDGAINQGVFFEALNLAAVWNAPIIFFYPHGRPNTLEWSSKRHCPDRRFEAKLEGKWIPDAFIGPTASLMQAIQEDCEPETSGVDNIQTLRVVEACYLSAAENRSVRLDECQAIPYPD